MPANAYTYTQLAQNTAKQITGASFPFNEKAGRNHPAQRPQFRGRFSLKIERLVRVAQVST